MLLICPLLFSFSYWVAFPAGALGLIAVSFTSGVWSLHYNNKNIIIMIIDLDAYGGASPDSIFPFFFMKTAQYVNPKISILFHKLIRAGSFSLC